MNKTFLLSFVLLVNLSLKAQFNVVDRLILDLPFSGNANDISGNHNNGIVHGAALTTDRLGNADNAYDFRTDSLSSIEIPASPSMDSITLLSGYTISAWIKARSWNSGGAPLLAILERHNLVTDGGIDFLAFPFGPYYDGQQGVFNFQFDQWYNVAVTINPLIDTLSFYVDGINVGSFFYTTPYDTSNHGPYSIGTSLTGSNEYSDGDIDDVKIYARALKDTEVVNNFTAIAEAKYGKPSLVVFPNPASSQLNVQWNNCEGNTATIQLLNALGETIIQQKISSNHSELDIQQFPSGIYFLSLQTGETKTIRKIIKQ